MIGGVILKKEKKRRIICQTVFKKSNSIYNDLLFPYLESNKWDKTKRGKKKREKENSKNNSHITKCFIFNQFSDLNKWVSLGNINYIYYHIILLC